MRRVILCALAGALLLTLAGPAAAAPPQRERFVDDIAEVPEDERVRYDCGGVQLVETGGTIQGTFMVQEMRDGTLRMNWSGQAMGLTAEDGDGNSYRLVGSGSGTARWAAGADPDVDDPMRGQFGLRLTILHEDGGKFGRVQVRGHLRPGGEFTLTERGNCVEV
jgi:hypothetical protein